jgi:transposase
LPEGFLEGSRCRHHGDLHGAESGDTTVRRYINAATAEELLTQVARRGRALDAHLDYLAERWQEGCTNAAWLAQELRARGYRGAERSVRRLLQTWRTGVTSPSAAPPATQTPRDVTGWIIRPTAKRTEQEQANLTRILGRCPTLRTLGPLVGDFAGMFRKRRGSISIPGSRTRDSDISQQIRGGLLKDYDTVRNGLTVFRSSGAVEGAVCRLKALKRQMFRRAKFHLLRQRVLRRGPN